MKFRVEDLVRKNDRERDKGSLYRVVATRTYEPCYQLRRQDNLAAKHWAITDELQLVSGIRVQNAGEPENPFLR